MILGIGIDVVHVYRLQRWRNVPGLFERFFHSEELKAVANHPEAILSLAARFAAKEAFGKAMGTGLRNLSLREIAVMNTPAGKPVMHVYGRAAQALEECGGKRILVSLSHEKTNALAVVIIEGEA